MVYKILTEIISNKINLERFNIKQIEVKKGGYVFCCENQITNLYLVDKGHIKISMTKGNYESTLAILGKGDIFGSLTFTKNYDYLIDAQALCKCKVYAMPHDKFYALILEMPELALSVIKELNKKIAQYELKLTNVLSGKSEEKIIAELKHLCACFGNQIIVNGYCKIAVKVTHEQIASTTGLTRESVSYVMSKLKKQGHLIVKNGFISVKKELIELNGPSS